MMTRKMTIAALAACGLTLAGCGSKPRPIASVAAPTAPAADIDAAFDLLMQGDEAGARKRLRTILKRDPNDAAARLLSDSLDRDPKDLLGPQSYAYSARAGDTVVGLAQRFLGNRLKAYQLLRYNALKAPAALVAGQELRIPGTPPRVEPVRRAEPEPSRPAPAVAAPKPKPATPRATAPAANAGLARQLRATGLSALNQGAVDRAVGLLRRAAVLDPGNTLITRDLARAQRIAATVKARR